MNHKDTKTQRGQIPEEANEAAAAVVDAAFRVHSTLGPGLLESVYEACLLHELKKKGVTASRQVQVPIVYDGVTLDQGLRLDLLVDGCLVVELKTVETLLPVHMAQVITYLKLTGHRLGLLINFNTPTIKTGIHRVVL